MIDLRHARFFVAVYEEESFSKAATRENSSQPAISLLISELEKRLKIKLFERHARGVRPTFGAKRLYQHCLAILSSVNAATQDMKQLSGAVSGTLRVGLPQTICEGALVPVLLRYTRQYPAVDIRLVQAASGTLNAMLLAKELDIAVVTPFPEPPPIRAQRIYDDRLVLISAPTRHLRPMQPCDLHSLRNLKLVLPSTVHGTRKFVDEFVRFSDIEVRQVIEMDGIVGMLDFVRQSDWMALLPFVAVRHDLAETDLVISPIAGNEIPMEYFLSNHASSPISAAGRLFAEVLSQELAEVAALWRRVSRRKHGAIRTRASSN
jgi:LysR family transcriptional regulator, nitrogen assimilation regulatory protein